MLALEEAAGAMTTRVKLKVDATGLTREKLVRLKQALDRHPGSCRVSLYLRVPGKGEAVLALPSQYRVAAGSELFAEVNGLFGHSVVEPILALE